MSNVIVLDTETTGKIEPALVQAAWIRIDSNLKILEESDQLFDPVKPIELGAMATHHITNEDVLGRPLSETFRLPADVEIIIGHKVDYDWKVIGSPNVRRICTLALAQYVWPNLDSHNLGALVYHTEKPSAKTFLTNAHSADVDVRNLLIVLGHIRNVLKVYDFEELWKVSEIARVPTVMPFGKHKGVLIRNVPSDYKRWLLGQPDVDPYLRQAINSI